MDNELQHNNDLIGQIKSILKKRKVFFITIIFIMVVAIIGIFFFKYYENSKNEKISEKYIKAGIYLSTNDIEKSNLYFKQIVLSKNKFYSILALNSIIENNLEKDKEKILDLFQVVENINLDTNQKNLVKLKKSLYLMKISKKQESNELLNEIINSNSAWKSIAKEIQKD